jgi:RNA polymerase sigma factor (sigma-70 family)
MSKLKQQFVSDLIADHGNSLERFLARKLDNPSDAAEIAQEAYLRIYRLQQPEKLDNARAFLFQVASNLAVDHLRRRTLHYRFLKSEEGQAEEGGATDPNASGASPEKILAARERLALIYATIDELPLKCRQAFLLSRNSGLSYNEIARELEVSVSSVEKYILQALKHCRAALARQDADTGSKAGQPR